MYSAVSPINFQGKVVAKNEFSKKPADCIKKVSNTISSMVREKDYNLYIRQDYGKNVISFEADYPLPYEPYQRKSLSADVSVNIPVTSKAARYTKAAETAVKKFEQAIKDQEQKEWEQKHKTDKIQDLKDMAENAFLFFPLFTINHILDLINPKWAKNFEKKVIDRMI